MVGSVNAIVIVPSTQQHELVGQPKVTNEAALAPNGQSTALRSTGDQNVKITIFDQFGKALDSIYDGSKVVVETWTGKDEQPAGILLDGPIEHPTGNLNSGVILDETQVSVNFNYKIVMTPAEIVEWRNFTYFIPGIHINNLVANPNLKKIFAKGVQHLTVQGHSVTPSFLRDMETAKINVPPSWYTVTDTAQ